MSAVERFFDAGRMQETPERQ
uniref:Uncharacterized protein n=1 Tax=Arundo donax TaxID=35708 RepID=A0A0A9U744_ARUDO